VPTYEGKRGNPVLFARRFINDMRRLRGDVGARHLIGENEEVVHEVALHSDAVLTDLDTQDALQRFNEKRLQEAKR
jgi:molybdenum cofactor cytidylyltransferase